MEESYDSAAMARQSALASTKGFFTTKVSVQLLKVLGEPLDRIHETLLR